MAIEMYEAQPLAWMSEEDQVVGSIWLGVEIATFFAYIMLGCLFMFLRSLKEHEVKIELVDKRKQLPSVDTVEALSPIIS